ncbi:hypothetical protein [Methylobacterium sp. J-090]|uniref:hypothetical protein n=1 Tax=Methylobacterium sp. J-090 TaxID=2836666 RepID=UPI001FBBFCCE|nr:hypothetical protein [Methylobacterium sp. J-090]MCJ2079854.1 hypothetical protein [Methylobacterium sp. J-090]
MGIPSGDGALQAGIDPAQAPSIEADAEEGYEIPERADRRALADGGNGTHHEAM